MIDIKLFKPDAVGLWVEYVPGVGPRERGRIKSWNEHNVFVVYNCDDQWHRFEDYTGAATDPQDLEWCSPPAGYVKSPEERVSG